MCNERRCNSRVVLSAVIVAQSKRHTVVWSGERSEKNELRLKNRRTRVANACVVRARIMRMYTRVKLTARAITRINRPDRWALF